MVKHRFYIRTQSPEYVWIIKRPTKNHGVIEYCINLRGYGHGDYKNKVITPFCREEIPSYIWKQVVQNITTEGQNSNN